MSRKNPKTSIDAHNSIKPAKSYYHQKIMDAMRVIRVGATYEEAAKVAGVRPDQAWRRMSELVASGELYNVGYTRKTSSGRQAMVRQIVGLVASNQPNPKTDKEANALRKAGIHIPNLDKPKIENPLFSSIR